MRWTLTIAGWRPRSRRSRPSSRRSCGSRRRRWGSRSRGRRDDLEARRGAASQVERDAVTVTEPWSTSTIAAPVRATADRWLGVRTFSTRVTGAACAAAAAIRLTRVAAAATATRRERRMIREPPPRGAAVNPTVSARPAEHDRRAAELGRARRLAQQQPGASDADDRHEQRERARPWRRGAGPAARPRRRSRTASRGRRRRAARARRRRRSRPARRARSAG